MTSYAEAKTTPPLISDFSTEHPILVPLFHYIFASLLFSIYSGQVCPLLEKISPLALFTPLVIVFFVRLYLVNQTEKFLSEQLVSRQFKLDFSLFILAGICFSGYNTLAHDGAWHSNLKVMVGMAILGLFVSIDLAIVYERALTKSLILKNKHIELTHRFTSFIHKFSVMATVIIFSISIVIFLVVNKDLEWLLEENINLTSTDARYSILKEIGFVLAVILAYTIRIIFNYSANLKMHFAHETDVITAVMQGNLTPRVPVTTHDEFGKMAFGINSMVDSLQVYQEELQVTRDASILALASLAETRDNETGAHILRTQHYVKVLAEHLSSHPDFCSELTEHNIDLMHKSAPLHDVGKVGIPDRILLKPGKLTDEEFSIMKNHAQLGADALLSAEKHMGTNSFLTYAREISATHHEKWDGSGYPRGQQGNDIPLSGRLMAIADVYDALICKRVYKPAFSHEKAKKIILEGKGRHFDPRLVEAFVECEQKFVAIAQKYNDKNC